MVAFGQGPGMAPGSVFDFSFFLMDRHIWGIIDRLHIFTKGVEHR